MKPLLVVLAALSLAANLALVGLLVAGRDSAAPAPTVAAPAAKPVVASPAESLTATLSAAASEELPAAIARLRAAGFPPHVIRALVSARVQELFAPRFKAARGDINKLPYWKTTGMDTRTRQAEYQLYREQREMLRQLLGPDAENPDQNLFSRLKLDAVPAAKLDAVKDAHRLAEDRRQEVYQTVMGSFTPDTQRKLDAINKDYQATLSGILSPAELEEYNLRNSEVSDRLRYELAAFNATEEEFRAIYKIWAPLETYRPGLTPAEEQRIGQSQREAREQVKGLLGPVRGAEYDRANDYSYRQTSMLVSRLELPPETTMKVWEVKQDIEKRALPIRMDRALSPEARTQQLAALAEEGTKRVTTLVGARGIEAYKGQGGGSWLQSLQPRPAPKR